MFTFLSCSSLPNASYTRNMDEEKAKCLWITKLKRQSNRSTRDTDNPWCILYKYPLIAFQLNVRTVFPSYYYHHYYHHRDLKGPEKQRHCKEETLISEWGYLHSSPGSTGYVKALTRRSPIGQLEELAFCWFRGLLFFSSSSSEQFSSQALGGSQLCWFTPALSIIYFFPYFIRVCCWF